MTVTKRPTRQTGPRRRVSEPAAEMISVAEAAEILGVTRSRVHQLLNIRRNGVPVIRSDTKFRHFYLVNKADVLAYREDEAARRPGPKSEAA